MKLINIGICMLFTSLLIGCVSTSNQESAGQYVDSSAITLKIKSSLLADPEVKSLPISVKTYKGRVELSGFVDSIAQKRKADDIARRVEGVISVTDAMMVKNH
jgi:hyperosmotically inducible protein